MPSPDAPPIACTLSVGNYLERLAMIAALSREALLSHRRRDLVLELRYDMGAADRVRELVRREQECCPFLAFEVEEGVGDAVRVTVTAPDEARGAVELLFKQFMWPAAETSPEHPCD